MQQPFNKNLKTIADEMGISLYTRMTINNASLFLHCSESDIKRLIEDDELEFINVPDGSIEFFGYQLLQYLLKSVSGDFIPVSQNSVPERILRTKEVQDMTGLSRTTLWRLERTGKFPARVSLGLNSIGWRYSEINEWILNRGNQ